MITEIKNQVFRNATVDVDGKRFIACQFVSCVLAYQGGEYGVWKLDGCALRTAQLLHNLKLLNIPITEHGISLLN